MKKQQRNGWVTIRGKELYARFRGDKLVTITYPNKTTCDEQVKKLNESGVDCCRSAAHPYTIIKAKT